ncbi:MAG TPA: hypothetical protein VMU64_08465 [Acidimicrobiales bacterium]|nr:hypothetical protein [Acidimicrobiales bacterium]
MAVDLRPVPGDPGLLEATIHDVKIGAVRLEVTGDLARMAAQVHATPGLEPRDIGDLVLATVERAKGCGATEVQFQCDSLLLRHEARRLGMRGGLRVPLGARATDIRRQTPENTAPEGSSPRRSDRRDHSAWLSARLNEVGVNSTPARPRRSLGRLATRWSGGVGDTLEVIVEWFPGRTFTISVPDRPDLMPEGVALTADTAAAVFRRFPDQADAVKAIRFDRSEHGLKSGRYAGVAEPSVPSIHLTITFVTTACLWPYTAVDATVAHELWHQIEAAFETREYALGMELRHQVGLELGVQTLEHAVKGADPKAPPDWQAAYRRLADEVSPYATTNAREATAELFKLWWCRNGPPAPVVARFGALVDQMLPPGTAVT